MPDEETLLSMGVGIATGLETAAANIYNIGEARKKADQEKKIFDLTAKQKKLEIQKSEHLLSPEQLRMESDKLKAEIKAQNAAYTLSIGKINAAEAEEKRKMESHKIGMSVLDKVLEGEGTVLGPGISVKAGPVTIKGQEDVMEKGYRDYISKYSAAQGSLPEKYRTKPMSLEEYKGMFGKAEEGGGKLTDDVLTQLDTYTDPDVAVSEFVDLYKDRGDEIDDIEVVIEGFREKFGDDVAEDVRSQIESGAGGLPNEKRALWQNVIDNPDSYTPEAVAEAKRRLRGL